MIFILVSSVTIGIFSTKTTDCIKQIIFKFSLKVTDFIGAKNKPKVWFNINTKTN